MLRSTIVYMDNSPSIKNGSNQALVDLKSSVDSLIQKFFELEPDKRDQFLIQETAATAKLLDLLPELHSDSSKGKRANLIDFELALKTFGSVDGMEVSENFPKLVVSIYERTNRSPAEQSESEWVHDQVEGLLDAIENYAELNVGSEEFILMKRWLDKKVTFLKEDLPDEQEAEIFLDSVPSLIQFIVGDTNLKGRVATGLTAYRTLAKQIFSSGLRIHQSIREGLDKIRLGENQLPNWLNIEGDQVLDKFDRALKTSRFSTAAAALTSIRYALENEGDRSDLSSLLSRVVSCISMGELEEPHRQYKAALFKDIQTTGNHLHSLESNRPPVGAASAALEAVISAQQNLKSLSTSYGLVSEHVAQYDETLALPDWYYEAIEKLQIKRIAPEGKSAGLKGVYDRDELRRLKDEAGAKFLVIERDQKVLGVVIIQNDPESFPQYLKDFAESSSKIDLGSHTYTTLLVADKLAAREYSLDMYELLFSAMKATAFSYDKKALIGWARSDNPVIVPEAKTGARVVSEILPIPDDDQIYQGVFMQLPLTHDELVVWNIPEEVKRAKRVLKQGFKTRNA